MTVERRAVSRVEAIRTVMRKDITAVRRSKAITIPMIALPAILFIGMPLTLGLAARSADQSQVFSSLNSPMLQELAAPIAGLPAREQLLILVLGYLLSPLLLVLPLMVSAVLAADAFAGEKERRTLESLLLLPVSDRDLFIAKVLSAYVPAVTITWVGALVYAVVANVVAWPVAGRVVIPFAQWAVMLAWIAPAVALVALGLLVIVSSRAKTTQEANQLGGAVILPLVFIAITQATVLLLMDVWTVLGVGLVIWIAGGLIVWFAGRRFTRDRLAAGA